MHPDERWSGAVCILDTIILSQKPSAGGITDTLTIVFMYMVNGNISCPCRIHSIVLPVCVCVVCIVRANAININNKTDPIHGRISSITQHILFSIRLKKNQSILFVLRIQCLCMSFNIVELHLLKTDIIAHLIATQFRIRPKPKGNESSYILFD